MEDPFEVVKKAPKRPTVRICRAIEITNQILPHFDVLKFEIGPLKAEK